MTNYFGASLISLGQAGGLNLPHGCTFPDSLQVVRRPISLAKARQMLLGSDRGRVGVDVKALDSLLTSRLCKLPRGWQERVSLKSGDSFLVAEVWQGEASKPCSNPDKASAMVSMYEYKVW